MIEHRICIASQDPSRHPLFTFGGILAVYIATAGIRVKLFRFVIRSAHADDSR